jgi:hypothetical protein
VRPISRETRFVWPRLWCEIAKRIVKANGVKANGVKANGVKAKDVRAKDVRAAGIQPPQEEDQRTGET